MEIALDPGVPTYSGGLGVLAGDTLRSAADLGIPMVAVTLLYRTGHFQKRLDAAGRQREEPVRWVVDRFVKELPHRASVTIAGRPVRLRAWQYDVAGRGGATVPVYLLDTDLPENAEADRRLTDSLYGGDQRHRLSQEIVLGIGGVRAATWTAPPFQRLFDRHIPGWRDDNFSLRYAVSMPADEVCEAHAEAKRELIRLVNRTTNAGSTSGS